MSLRIDYKQLAALDAVIREQSFDKAARSLHITQSAVSQRLSQLEHSVGQRLLTRAQPMAPTAQGEHLLRHVRQVALLERELEHRMNADADSYQVLAVAVSNDTLAWFVRTCMQWMPSTPRTLLQVYVDDESRTQQMMRNGTVLGCISQHPTALPGGEVTELGAMRFYCVATPAFARQHFPHGMTDSALARAPAVLVSHDDPLHFDFLAQQHPDFDGVFPFHLIPSINEFVDVITAGAGFGLVSSLLIGERLNQGELVDLCPAAPFHLPLFWHRWAMQSTLISRLTDSLMAEARRLLD
ncbi:LysR family transcriptional regulator ArgP [Paludibacterium sp. THUN1379]|uniref:LysR family transcriptional regulator ArgP n=1 Tax=Paludibacterium sp. THUN1379 TaxID=3112107 RepID=UPI0030850B64|nr:LysR family transcriptional regulator ArgP [Paludibacterium sp. THUN1379]